MAKISNVNSNNYNLFAILALIFTFVFYPVGLILAFISLSQIKKSGEKGKWMAWVPIWIGIVLLILIVLGIIWVVISNLAI